MTVPSAVQGSNLRPPAGPMSAAFGWQAAVRIGANCHRNLQEKAKEAQEVAGLTYSLGTAGVVGMHDAGPPFSSAVKRHRRESGRCPGPTLAGRRLSIRLGIGREDHRPRVRPAKLARFVGSSRSAAPDWCSERF